MDKVKLGIIDYQNWQPYFTFILFTCLGLILSIPFANNIGEYGQYDYLSSSPNLFFFIYVLFVGILGLNLGATSASRKEIGATFFKNMAGRILLTHMLILPIIIFESLMIPWKTAAIILLLIFGSVIQLLFYIFSYLIESSDWSSSPKFLLRYFSLMVYFFLPFGFFPMISPLMGVNLIFSYVNLIGIFSVYAIPIALIVFELYILFRVRGGDIFAGDR